ncbi:DUF5009 domain-containing protein [Bacteroides sp. OttesenSCG-928-J23]|nr:DUF5009 domain-containing protein [Bacteroides sp. OttesenSCG-928-J23]MDL2299712.1 DUF5009 domain-containing protein [Bacteroides sp. OttesenSCG-928-E20]
MAKNAIDFTQRNVAIDILRALTMLLMIFVNDLWTIEGEPYWLGHAKGSEDFMGLADIVFPCFLIVVGMSIPFAIESRFKKGFSGVSTVGHILTRTLALLIMGVFIVNTESGIAAETGMSLGTFRILMVVGFLLIWNVYPRTDNLRLKRTYSVLKFAGFLLLLYLAIVFRDAEGGVFQSRWWGILGAIGWTYLICAMIYIFARDRFRYLVPIWVGFILLCVLKSSLRDAGPILNLPHGNFFDQFLGILHVGNGALPAFTMGGLLLSLLSTKYVNTSNRNKVQFAIIATLGLLILGVVAHQFWIVSKIRATPPWIFYCSAIAVGTYSLIYWLVEKGKASWFSFISPAGTATLTCYLIPYVTYSLTAILGIKLPEFLTTGWVGVLNCVVFSFLIIFITGLLGRIHIKLKI